VQGMWKLPLTSYPLFNLPDSSAGPTSTHALAPYFLDWLAHPDYDDYWKRVAIEEHFADINVPILTVAAWYDIFQGGSFKNYMGIRAHGGDGARSGQRSRGRSRAASRSARPRTGVSCRSPIPSPGSEPGGRWRTP